MLINNAISLLARELRDVNTPYQFMDDDLYSALVDGVDELNTRGNREYEVVGTGSSATISPEPGITDKKVWILCSAIQILRGEKIKASATAMTLSNSGGRTDLTSIPEAIGSAVAILQTRVNQILFMERRMDVEGQMGSREKTRQVVE